ncbi:MAG: kynureninase [Flavobacteriales bacterium]|nr:kynureninase [Flavobacteriales bacterium]
MSYQNTLSYAREADQQDSLKDFRSKFLFPQHEGKDVIYFTGNSLGLQPKSTAAHLQQELDDWAKYGVEGHFLAKNPWFSYHELLTASCARIVGAKPIEVVCMNQLTVNLHLLMVSFYRPTPQRYKILCEAKAFPSDQYALETQVEWHGFRPQDAIIEISPREGEHVIRTEDVLTAIEANKNELALVMIGGVNYYSGQVFDMKTITKAAHEAGAYAGWDLAHAAGNIELKLHEWEVDFAAWCSYKYMNAGPGSVSGVFIHEKHAHSNLPRFAGWWGHDKSVRFKMEKGFHPIPGAEGWQLSNAPVLSMAAYKASLELFDQAGMEKLIEKSKKLSGYLEFIIGEINRSLSGKDNYPLEIITPRDWKERGAQLSIIAHGFGKELFNQLVAKGVIPDWREPNVIRLAPVPMYNSFEDMYQFGAILSELLKK